MQKIIRLTDVLELTRLSKTTIYRFIDLGLWPKPIKLGARAIGWPENEVEMMIQARISGKSNESISTIVADIEKIR